MPIELRVPNWTFNGRYTAIQIWAVVTTMGAIVTLLPIVPEAVRIVLTLPKELAGSLVAEVLKIPRVIEILVLPLRMINPVIVVGKFPGVGMYA